MVFVFFSFFKNIFVNTSFVNSHFSHETTITLFGCFIRLFAAFFLSSAWSLDFQTRTNENNTQRRKKNTPLTKMQKKQLTEIYPHLIMVFDPCTLCTSMMMENSRMCNIRTTIFQFHRHFHFSCLMIHSSFLFRVSASAVAVAAAAAAASSYLFVAWLVCSAARASEGASERVECNILIV